MVFTAPIVLVDSLEEKVKSMVSHANNILTELALFINVRKDNKKLLS